MTKRALLWIVGLGPAVAALLTTYNVAQPSFSTDSGPYTGWRLLAAQTLGTALLGFSLMAIYQGFRNRRSEQTGRILMVSSAALLTGPIISSVVGGHGGPWQRLLMTPLVFVAFYVGPHAPMRQLISDIRRIMRIYMWGSLFSLLVAPRWATHLPFESASNENEIRDYLGIGLRRLYGLTDHPNLLGAIAAASLAIELAPVVRQPWWLLHASAAAGVLLLTQSRTAWFCAIAVTLLRSNKFRSGIRPGVLCAFGVVFLCATTLLLPSMQQMFTDELARPDISSLNNRTRAWEYALREFQKNPLVGYGPNIFSLEYRRDVIHDPSLMWVGQAHNQVLQTMGDSGLVGLAGLATFITVLLVVGARLAQRTAGLLLVLPIMMVTRSFTESPLEILGSAVNLTLATFTWLLLLSAENDRVTAAPQLPRKTTSNSSRWRPAELSTGDTLGNARESCPERAGPVPR